MTKQIASSPSRSTSIRRLLNDIVTGARLVRAWGVRDAAPTLLDLQRSDASVRFRRHGAVLQMVRDGTFSSTIMNLMKIGSLQRLAELVGDDDDVVIDAGSSSGLFSRLVKERHPGVRLIAIEANPRLVPIIRWNLHSFDNWDIVPKALTNNAAGVVTFYRNEDAPQTSSLERGSAEIVGRWPAEEISVASTSVDAIAEQFGLEKIDVLKMDIQGAETLAIAGAAATLPRLSKLIIEVSFLDPRPEMLLAQLHEEFGEPVVVQLVLGGADLLYTRS